MQKSTSAFTCYARVKVSTSCNSIVLLQTILLRPLDSTIRYLIDPKGEAEKPYVCAAVPCDASGHLTVEAILLTESRGDESVTVEPQNLDRNSNNLYQNMDLCIAGKSGNTATATCKETTSESVKMVLKGLDFQNLHVIHFRSWFHSVSFAEELDSLLSRDQQTETIEQQQDSKGILNFHPGPLQLSMQLSSLLLHAWISFSQKFQHLTLYGAVGLMQDRILARRWLVFSQIKLTWSMRTGISRAVSKLHPKWKEKRIK